MTGLPDRDEALTMYCAYLEVCNRHAWAELRAFIADEVAVNGETLVLVSLGRAGDPGQELVEPRVPGS